MKPTAFNENDSTGSVFNGMPGVDTSFCLITSLRMLVLRKCRCCYIIAGVFLQVSLLSVDGCGCCASCCSELDEDAPMRDRENSEGMDETSGTAQHHNGQVPLGAGEKELKDQSMNEKMICETVNSCRKKRKKLTLAANPDSKKLALTANPDNKKKLALTANPHNKKKLALTANPDSKKLALTANPDSKKKLALTANLHNKKLALTTNPDSGKVALTANLDSKEKAPKPLRRRKKDVKTDKRDDIISEETVPANKGRVKGMRGKKRRKDGGRKGYQPIEMITDSRLLALGIDPKKFKYTKHKLSTVKSSSH